LVDDAVETISKYGDFEWFVSDDPYVAKPKEIPPWALPCGDDTRDNCSTCPYFHNDAFHCECTLGHDISGVMQALAKEEQEDYFRKR
jgi:hypothetical protein